MIDANERALPFTPLSRRCREIPDKTSKVGWSCGKNKEAKEVFYKYSSGTKRDVDKEQDGK